MLRGKIGSYPKASQFRGKFLYDLKRSKNGDGISDARYCGGVTAGISKVKPLKIRRRVNDEQIGLTTVFAKRRRASAAREDRLLSKSAHFGIGKSANRKRGSRLRFSATGWTRSVRHSRRGENIGEECGSRCSERGCLGVRREYFFDVRCKSGGRAALRKFGKRLFVRFVNRRRPYGAEHASFWKKTS